MTGGSVRHHMSHVPPVVGFADPGRPVLLARTWSPDYRLHSGNAAGGPIAVPGTPPDIIAIISRAARRLLSGSDE